MKQIGEFLRSTIVGGPLIILPIGLMAIIIGGFLAIFSPVTKSIAARVHRVAAPLMDTVKCVSRFGTGAEKLLRSKRVS